MGSVISVSADPAYLIRARVGRRGRVWFDRRLSPFYLVIAAQLGVLIAAVQAGLFTFEPEPLSSDAVFLAALAAGAMAARWLTFTALADLVEAAVLFLAIAILTPLCAAVLATSNRPLADGLLASLDARLFLGFDRRLFVAVLAQHPAAIRIAGFAYDSLNWQPFVLFAMLYGTRRVDKAWTFLLAWVIALVVTLAIFPFVPAVSTPPYRMHWVLTLQRVRDGQLRCLGAEVLTGIVAFPSFHAAAAVMLGWGSASLRYARAPLIALNAVMLVSAIAGGGHYLVDLVAGAVVAIGSIRAAIRFGAFTR